MNVAKREKVRTEKRAKLKEDKGRQSLNSAQNLSG